MADLTTFGVASAASSRVVVDWRTSFARRLALTDAAALLWVMFGTELVWLGFGRTVDAGGAPLRLGGISYSLVSFVIAAIWMLALSISGTRNDRVIGTGSTEYKLIFDATLRVFFLVAVFAFLFKVDLARGYILISLPLGLAALFVERWLWRQWLQLQRAEGAYSSRVILIGSRESIAHIGAELRRATYAGYSIVGAIVPGQHDAVVLPTGPALPIVGDVDRVIEAMDRTDADTVVITSGDELSPERVRRISWSLEPGRRHLVMAPSLTDVGGPRIHTRPVAGLPLMHVETPRYEGGQRAAKRVFDIVGSGLLLLVLSPVLLGAALAVKLTSPGPVFYKQERVGRDGGRIYMLKFRSMIVNADAQLKSLLEEQGTVGTPLFKVKNDPRLTRVGAFLRKYSIDELPQLFNVFNGEMSLVGPRPQRDPEVELYDAAAWRRLNVQPGMTGLWQVSGRSTLSWEEAIRLDLYYVENWSLAGDLVILWRTLRAVLAPGEDAF
ncbi:sugar transferase [Gryllotalpicola koreensis]|uniref:Sugar transferase n=1 Tax=Gryllotalpicola koreensis TaxID=993086 RepID=A0ABP8A0G9_9MICO